MINPTTEQNRQGEIIVYGDNDIEITPDGHVLVECEEFTLSNPADMLATVKALGEKKGITIWANESSSDWSRIPRVPSDPHYETYEEAVLAALDSLEDV